MCMEYVDSSTFKDKVEEARKKNDIKTNKQREINILNNKIKSNLSYIDQIYEDKLKGNIDMEMFNRSSLRFKEEIEQYKNQVAELELEISKLDNEETNKQKQDILKKINEYLSFEKPNRSLLVNLIDNILISEDKTVEIHYKFRVN